jgi:transposase InsO family protein
MWKWVCAVFLIINSIFKCRKRLVAENTCLRLQVETLKRPKGKSHNLTKWDRVAFALLYWLYRSVAKSMVIVKSDTLVKWHRQGFKLFWRWKSRAKNPGRPEIDHELRALIRRMARENPLWGAPRIHGELLMLGFALAESTVAKYMPQRRGPPDGLSRQSWKTFLANHKEYISVTDFLTIPSLGFKQLYAMIIVDHHTRAWRHIATTTNPTAHWAAQQLREAFPWDHGCQYLVRDNDAIFGTVFRERLRGMSIKDTRTAYHSPWQNGFAERIIGTIKRERLDHTVILNEHHLLRILKEFQTYYNGSRTHISLSKDSPHGRSPSAFGQTVVSQPFLGGLHHVYARA